MNLFISYPEMQHIFCKDIVFLLMKEIFFCFFTFFHSFLSFTTHILVLLIIFAAVLLITFRYGNN